VWAGNIRLLPGPYLVVLKSNTTNSNQNQPKDANLARVAATDCCGERLSAWPLRSLTNVRKTSGPRHRRVGLRSAQLDGQMIQKSMKVISTHTKLNADSYSYLHSHLACIWASGVVWPNLQGRSPGAGKSQCLHVYLMLNIIITVDPS
jgi:hypothetical protein